MNKLLIPVVALAFAITAPAADPIAATPKKPKLILAIVIDQFRYDYILKFRKDYTAGLKRILDQGAVFHDAHHISFPTVTAVGHSTFLSGATPSQSGIVANEWFDRETNKSVTSVSDPATKLVGGPATKEGSSPRRLLVSTLGDEIKMAGEKNRVIGISIKDRSAILPAGHMADAAYWFDAASNRWTTSTYYMKELPQWIQNVNSAEPEKRAVGQTWYPVDSKPDTAKPFCTMVQGTSGVRYCGSIEASPYGNELIEELAEMAVVAEKMGQHDGTDLLSVSFSSNDYVGHAVGPDDPAIRDISIRTDRLLGKLLNQVDQSVGLDNVVVVLTADHGVSPVPEVNVARRMNGGRISEPAIAKAINEALTAKFGEGKWLATPSGGSPYFNLDLVESKKLNIADIESTAADAIRKLPHIFRVYTKEQLMKGQVTVDPVSTMLTNGFFPSRVADLLIVQEPFYLTVAGQGSGTTHGTPFNYDSHVPVIFMGNAVKPGHYYGRIAVNDIAPTLAAIAGVLEPSGSVGRVLVEMLK